MRAAARALAALTWLAAAACTPPAEGPPQVRWGSDECSHCHMIVAEPRFAAVARAADGSEARFDDLGCLLRWHREADRGGWQVWVHDATAEGWLPAAAASYARSPGRATPMGSGLTAHRERSAAAAAAPAVLTWAELLALQADADRDMMAVMRPPGRDADPHATPPHAHPGVAGVNVHPSPGESSP